MTTATTFTELTGDYAIDASHTRIGFVARHAMVTKVRGAFNEFDGRIKIDGDNPANSSAVVTINAASIDTRNAQRDEHLRGSDFLELDKFPRIQFASTSVAQDGDTFSLTGDLTIKGVTKPVTIEFEQTGSARDPFGNLRVGFEGSTAINRKDWGLTWNAALETGGVLVSDRIKLEFDISAIQNAAADQA